MKKRTEARGDPGVEPERGASQKATEACKYGGASVLWNEEKLTIIIETGMEEKLIGSGFCKRPQENSWPSGLGECGTC